MTFANLRVETEKGIRQDRLSLFIFLFSLFSVLSQVSLILTASGNLPPQLPLFYSKPWGEQMLAPQTALLILPTICAAVLLVNLTVAIIFLKGKRFLARTLFVFSLIVAVATLYDTVKIISLLT